MVNRRLRWIKNPVPEISFPAPEIQANAGALLLKMAAFIFSDLLTPLQKHHDSLRPPISEAWGFDQMGFVYLAQKLGSKAPSVAFCSGLASSFIHGFSFFFTAKGKEKLRERDERDVNGVKERSLGYCE